MILVLTQIGWIFLVFYLSYSKYKLQIKCDELDRVIKLNNVKK